MKLEKLVGNKPHIVKKILNNELYRFTQKFEYYRQMGASRQEAYNKVKIFYRIK